MQGNHNKPYSPNTANKEYSATTSKSPTTNSIEQLIKENDTKSNAIEFPSITLPKGGGALKGIDEKFQVNPANGTAGYSLPLPVTPGRNGFTPYLSLSYNSGSGNGPFGLGWDLALPSIQRKTDKKLPRYRDESDEDIFMFSEVEDLVPFLFDNNGKWEKREIDIEGYTAKRLKTRRKGYPLVICFKAFLLPILLLTSKQA